MPFNPASLLAPPQRPDKVPADSVSCVEVFGLSAAIELSHLHKELTRAFAAVAPDIAVNLQAADLIRKQDTQECKVTLSQPVDSLVVELTIHEAVSRQHALLRAPYQPGAIELAFHGQN